MTIRSDRWQYRARIARDLLLCTLAAGAIGWAIDATATLVIAAQQAPQLAERSHP